jgi:DNA-binding NarL/FixJ family response regulator
LIFTEEQYHAGTKQLTPTEKEIFLAIVAEGLSNWEIAKRRVVSTGTVKCHCHTIMGKFGFTEKGTHNKRLLLAIAFWKFEGLS